METNTKERLQIIHQAASEASEKLYDIKMLLEEAEEEAGYRFSHYIKQEIDEAYPSGLKATFDDLASGDKNDEILEELKEV